MAHISGTFSNAAAGRLRITLSGVFIQGVDSDGGFPVGASNMLVRAVINGNNGPTIDRYNRTSYFELDYPGGSASWSVSTVRVSSASGGGTATYGFDSLKLELTLVKK